MYILQSFSTHIDLGLGHDLVDVTLVLVEKGENHPEQQK